MNSYRIVASHGIAVIFGTSPWVLWGSERFPASIACHCNGISVTALNLYLNVIRISMILRRTLVQ